MGYLDLVAAGVDHQRLGIASQLLHPIFGHVAVAAEQLDGLHRDIGGGLRGIQLDRRGLGQRQLFAGFEPLDGLKYHVLHVDPRNFHFRQLQLDQLELPDVTAPQRAGLCVIHTQPVAFVDDAQRHERHAEAFDGEIGAGAVAAVPLGAKQAIRGQPHVVEEQLAGRRRHHAHLLERLALRQARHAGIEHKDQHRAVTPI
ncbi:Uncharacterised protein [Mycobacterium tuberculosis]|nr:Uncharacterised protein [Mycobacterium tuberculosis]CNX86432.1 Uncharacterised protein [Mycobacterium tuberculosis]CNY56556.1 Uncharacterised protein [Mycobacterium tuberculosis]CNZ00894.1 Uncharacterised protein [Mycobacterium tuberculosis]COW32058.1 Uncharacterised protein [Mycobacterium tuberculosis]